MKPKSLFRTVWIALDQCRGSKGAALSQRLVKIQEERAAPSQLRDVARAPNRAGVVMPNGKARFPVSQFESTPGTAHFILAPMHPNPIPPSTLTQAAAANRPRVGDYLQAPELSAHRIYIVLNTDGYHVHAASAARGSGLVTIDTTWPRLASAGFRLRRYDDMQEGRLRMIVILATLILMSVLTFVLAAPLSFTQVVSMSITLLVGHVAVTVLNGYRRDFFLHRTVAHRG